jgi:hypothetical protein
MIFSIVLFLKTLFYTSIIICTKYLIGVDFYIVDSLHGKKHRYVLVYAIEVTNFHSNCISQN